MLSTDPNDPRLWHVSDHGVRHVVAKRSDQYLLTLLSALEEIAQSSSGSAERFQQPIAEKQPKHKAKATQVTRAAERLRGRKKIPCPRSGSARRHLCALARYGLDAKKNLLA